MTAWPTVLLGEVSKFVRGVTFKPADVVPAGTPGSVSCMRTKNVQQQLDLSDVWSIDARHVKREEQYLQHGDLLISSANSWNIVGKCSWVPDLDARASFGGFVSVLRPDPAKVDQRYLYWFYSSDQTQVTVRSFSRQTTNIANLDLKRCVTMAIPLPPLPEQRRIAAILDHVDALRAKRREALAQLEELTHSIVWEMFGDLGPGRSRMPSCRVDQAGRVQLGRQRSPKYQTGVDSRPYLRVANVHEDRIDVSNVLSMDFGASDYEIYRLRMGDILLNEGQSSELVGRPAMWRDELQDCCFQNSLIRFVADPLLCTPEFALTVFLHYLKSGQFAKTSTKTSSVAHLGAARFAAMPFPLPALDVQKKFTDLINRIRDLKVQHRTALAELDALFASLQSRAFRGEL